MFRLVRFMLLPLLIRSTILRLPECGKYDADFSVVSSNKKLERGLLLLELIVITSVECYKSCLLHKRCYSVNYHQGKQICQLMGFVGMTSSQFMEIVGSSAVSHLVANVGWFHVQTAFKEKIGLLCESHDQLCRWWGSQCRDTCSAPHFYECVYLPVRLYDLGKNHIAVSQSTDALGLAELAIDGNKNQTDPALCTQVFNGGMTRPWWKVIFKHGVIVQWVQVLNRMDCCTRSLNAIEILLLTPRGEEVCGYTDLMENIAKRFVRCSRTLSHGIKIQSRGDNILTLCEVYVYGFEL